MRSTTGSPRPSCATWADTDYTFTGYATTLLTSLSPNLFLTPSPPPPILSMKARCASSRHRTTQTQTRTHY